MWGLEKQPSRNNPVLGRNTSDTSFSPLRYGSWVERLLKQISKVPRLYIDKDSCGNSSPPIPARTPAGCHVLAIGRSSTLLALLAAEAGCLHATAVERCPLSYRAGRDSNYCIVVGVSVTVWCLPFEGWGIHRGLQHHIAYKSSSAQLCIEIIDLSTWSISAFKPILTRHLQSNLHIHVPQNAGAMLLHANLHKVIGYLSKNKRDFVY